MDYRYTTTLDRIQQDAKNVKKAAKVLLEALEYMDTDSEKDKAVILQHYIIQILNCKQQVSEMEKDLGDLADFTDADMGQLGYYRQYNFSREYLLREPLTEEEKEEAKPDETV